MKFDVHLGSTSDGQFEASCDEMNAAVRCLSPGCALDRLREEIHYRLEICPCRQVEIESIELEVVQS